MTIDALPSPGRRIIDLSHPLRTGMPVFPGDPGVRIRPAATIPEVGVNVASLELGSHSGTHVDAPLHSVDGAESIDMVDPGRLIGPARVITVTGLAPRTRIDVDAVSDQLRAVRPGDIVLFRTDWSTRFGEREYLDHPYLDPAVAVALLRAGVTVMGIDALNPDETPLDDAVPHLPFHDVFLGAGGLIVENLTGLGRITAPGALFIGLPLPIAGGDGSPVRAIVVEEPVATD